MPVDGWSLFPPTEITSTESEWLVVVDPIRKTTYGRLVLTEAARSSMHPDRLKMLDDAANNSQRALAEPDQPTPQGEMQRAAIEFERREQERIQKT